MSALRIGGSADVRYATDELAGTELTPVADPGSFGAAMGVYPSGRQGDLEQAGVEAGGRSPHSCSVRGLNQNRNPTPSRNLRSLLTCPFRV
jgi:hypothetical protein